MADDPHALFDSWLAEAALSEPNDPEAMCLSTADESGRPSSRMVLLKGNDDRGFTFHTNMDSRKGGELSANPRASLLFHWKTLRRQVRIEGTVSRVSDEEADAYFATRGRESRLGAWASSQSRPLDGRAAFDARYQDTVARFEGQDVPRPPYWGGYRVAPDYFEFWMDRAHRLHERRTFVRAGDRWTGGMLYP